MVAMLVKPEEDPSRLVAPKPAPSGYIAPKVSAAIRVKFSTFEDRVIHIQCNLKKNTNCNDDFQKYDEWLHAFTAQHDGQAVPRKASYRTVLEWKLIKINDEYVRTPVLGKHKKWWLTPRVCKLLPGDSWGACEKTINLYSARTNHSTQERQAKKRGNLQLIFSQPSYPDPFVRSNAEEPLRPMTVKQIVAEALKTSSVGGMHDKAANLRALMLPNVYLRMLRERSHKVQAANDEVFGPPRPEETGEKVLMSYDGNVSLDATVAYLEKLRLMAEVGHCEVARPVPLAYKRRLPVKREAMLVKYPGYATELIYPEYTAWEDSIACEPYTKALRYPKLTAARNRREMGKCAPHVDDEQRYIFYWRDKEMPREQDWFVERFIENARPGKGEPWRGVVRALLSWPYATIESRRADQWQFMRMMSRQKKYHRFNRKLFKPCLRRMSDDNNVIDTRLRMYWNQYTRGKISAEELRSAESKFERLGKLLEERKLLPMAVGKPYGDWSREEKIVLTRFNMSYEQTQWYHRMKNKLDEEVEPVTAEVELDSADVMAAHVVCRVLGDGEDSIIKGEYIPKGEGPKANTPIILPDSAVWSDRLFPEYATLPSGVWVPKYVLGWRNYKEIVADVPDAGVKTSEGSEAVDSKFEARVRHPGSRFRR